MNDITRLVLARKQYESINIAGMITVTVEEIRGRTVRIAIEAPRGIAVHRREIYERILSTGRDDDGAAGVLVLAGPSGGPDRSPARRAAARMRPGREPDGDGGAAVEGAGSGPAVGPRAGDEAGLAVSRRLPGDARDGSL